MFEASNGYLNTNSPNTGFPQFWPKIFTVKITGFTAFVGSYAVVRFFEPLKVLKLKNRITNLHKSILQICTFFFNRFHPSSGWYSFKYQSQEVL